MDNILKNISNKIKGSRDSETEKKPKPEYVCSAILEDGSIVEMVFDPKERETKFAIFKDGEINYQKCITISEDKVLIPLSADGSIVKNSVVLFPSKAEEYESESELIEQIKQFIHRHVSISSLFEKICTYYVLFTYVYDKFNELPYLRFLGDWGTGKSRAMKTVGSICFKPIMASGATTASPIFRILDMAHGTLNIDEADFKLSDSWVEIIKILNCGYERGSPVLRSEGQDSNFEPKAFHVFGPKILATRERFQDQALESRCLTEQMEKKTVSQLPKVPLNIPESFKQEAINLRNKLLMWRFKNYNRVKLMEESYDRNIEPRLNQIFAPLLSIITDDGVKADLKQIAKQLNDELLIDRGMQFEAEVLEIILNCVRKGEEPTMKEIARAMNFKYDYESPTFKGKKFTPQYIGHVVRKKLNLHPERTNSGFIIRLTEKASIEHLREKFGFPKELEDKSDQEIQQEAETLENQYPEEFGSTQNPDQKPLI